MALYYRIIHYVKTITTTDCSLCQSKLHSHFSSYIEQRLELANAATAPCMRRSALLALDECGTCIVQHLHRAHCGRKV